MLCPNCNNVMEDGGEILRCNNDDCWVQVIKKQG